MENTKMYESRILEVNKHCVGIAKELVEYNEFVCFDRIVQVLLDRYSCMKFSDLQVGDYHNVPLLLKVWELDMKINIFIDSYFASRSIVTLKDLEDELLLFLQSFCLPSLLDESYQQNKSDPDEISLDSSYKEIRFSDYGCGELSNHPKILLKFSSFYDPHSVNDTNNLPTSQHLLQLLIDYLVNDNWSLSYVFHVENYIKYLCDYYEVEHLESIGIYIQGDLNTEIQSLKHILSKKAGLYASFAKMELNKYNQEMNNLMNYSNKNQTKKRKRKKSNSELDVINEKINEFLVEIRELSDDEKDEAYTIDETKNIMNKLFTFHQESEKEQNNETSYMDKILDLLSYFTVEKLNATSSKEFETETTIQENIPNNIQTDLIIETNKKSNMNIKLQNQIISSEASCRIEKVENKELIDILPMVKKIPKNTNNILSNKDIGRWGEALVYQYLIKKFPIATQIVWLNEKEESLACYDFKVLLPFENRVKTIFIEVKSTRFSAKNYFELSLNEYNFLSSNNNKVTYQIYRVFNVGDQENVDIMILSDVNELIQQNKVKLCLSI